MSLDTNLFLESLKDMGRFSQDDIHRLNRGLIKTGAVIAGGAVLKPYALDQKSFKWNHYQKDSYSDKLVFPHRLHMYDLDIYVNSSKGGLLGDLFKTQFKYKFIRNNDAPSYDQSFFRKNNIHSRFRLIKEEKEEKEEHADIDGNKTTIIYSIDIMLIPDHINVLDVVKNFDLSFAEIWYDGKTVQAVDVKGVLENKGVLKKDYTESFLKHNNYFILNRMRKYAKRGFKIWYDFENSCEIKTEIVIKKNIKDGEEWAVKFYHNKIVKIILDSYEKMIKISNFNIQYKEKNFETLDVYTKYVYMKRLYTEYILPYKYFLYTSYPINKFKKDNLFNFINNLSTRPPTDVLKNDTPLTLLTRIKDDFYKMKIKKERYGKYISITHIKYLEDLLES